MLVWLLPLSKIWCGGNVYGRNLSREGSVHHEGETVMVSIQLNLETSPTITTDGVGCQKVGAVSFKPTKCHIQREREKKSYFHI